MRRREAGASQGIITGTGGSRLHADEDGRSRPATSIAAFTGSGLVTFCPLNGEQPALLLLSLPGATHEAEAEVKESLVVRKLLEVLRGDAPLDHLSRYRLTTSGYAALGVASPEEQHAGLSPSLEPMVDGSDEKRGLVCDHLAVLILAAGFGECDTLMIDQGVGPSALGHASLPTRVAEQELLVVCGGSETEGGVPARCRLGPTYLEVPREDAVAALHQQPAQNTARRRR